MALAMLRAGGLFPGLVGRGGMGRALCVVVVGAYVHGVSVRLVGDLVKALGCDAGISQSEVSRICADLDEQLDAFWMCLLDHIRLPGLFCGVCCVFRRQDDAVVCTISMSVGFCVTASSAGLSVGMLLCVGWVGGLLSGVGFSPRCA
ncbi:transposase [Streptomyces cellulosae]